MIKYSKIFYLKINKFSETNNLIKKISLEKLKKNHFIIWKINIIQFEKLSNFLSVQIK